MGEAILIRRGGGENLPCKEGEADGGGESHQAMRKRNLPYKEGEANEGR